MEHDHNNVVVLLEFVINNCRESRWLCGNTLASDANGPISTPGGTLELDTDDHPFVGRRNV